MTLSAIVPTHDRPEVLRRCLETLRSQDVAASEFEVVVVDDGSRSDIGAVVAAVSALGSIPMRCARQPLTGLNGARNRGVAAARGDILAFLDDDTLVSEGWATALLQAFDSFPCAAIGGRVELSLAGPAPDWIPELGHYLAAYDLGSESRWLDDDDPVPVGANCAVRRSEFDRMGGFRPGLDRIAESLVSNGDTEFFRRLRAGGGRLRYEPGPSVIHCIPRERLTVSYFVKRHRDQAVSDELLLRLQGHVPTLGHKVGLARELGGTSRLLCKDVLRGRGTARARFLASYWAGRLSAAGVVPSVAGRRTGSEANVVWLGVEEGEDDRQAIVDRLLADPPAVHVVDTPEGKAAGVWSTETSCYRLIARLSIPGCRTLETGCGLSTALFAALGTHHRCVTPAVEETDLLVRYLEERGIRGDRVTFDVEPSHRALPRLDQELDLVLIDGGHAFPLPIVDWFYACSLLRAGGTLIVDDLQLPAVRDLVDFLERDPRWEQIARTDKWAGFRRLSDWDLAEGWWEQPFYSVRPSGFGPLLPRAVTKAKRTLRNLGGSRAPG